MSDQAPPAWGQQLLSLIQTMQQQTVQIQQQQEQMQQQQSQIIQQHAQLQQQFEALRVSDPAPPPPLAPTISAEALATLVAHPFLSEQDTLYARLLQAAFPVIISE